MASALATFQSKTQALFTQLSVIAQFVTSQAKLTAILAAVYEFGLFSQTYGVVEAVEPRGPTLWLSYASMNRILRYQGLSAAIISSGGCYKAQAVDNASSFSRFTTSLNPYHVVRISGQHCWYRRRSSRHTSQRVRTHSLLCSDSFPSLQAHLDPHASIYPAIDPGPLYAAQSFSGKVALVTGASRGVGRETALQYARAGASVAILARSKDTLDETKEIIIAAVPGADVLVLTADVRDMESVRAAVESALRRFGKLDILIANAGAITSFTPRKNYFTLPLLSLLPFCSWNLLFICFI